MEQEPYLSPIPAIIGKVQWLWQKQSLKKCICIRICPCSQFFVLNFQQIS